jgi:hypothetical protein
MRISLCLEQEYELLRSNWARVFGQLIHLSPILSGFLFRVLSISSLGIFGAAIGLAILAPMPIGNLVNLFAPVPGIFVLAVNLTAFQILRVGGQIRGPEGRFQPGILGTWGFAAGGSNTAVWGSITITVPKPNPKTRSLTDISEGDRLPAFPWGEKRYETS